jgi:hypothetical protein
MSDLGYTFTNVTTVGTISNRFILEDLECISSDWKFSAAIPIVPATFNLIDFKSQNYKYYGH